MFSDLGRIRTLNPQSRNLIFYPVELRGQRNIGCKCKILATLIPHFLIEFFANSYNSSANLRKNTTLVKFW